METARYRPNVAALLQNHKGRILICERLDIPNAWQFPQGGIKRGETQRQALAREMIEELSLAEADYEVVRSKAGYSYLFGEGKTKRGYHGQEQEYFLLQLMSSEERISVQTVHPEFKSYRWIEPGSFDLRWLPAMKREVYRQVMLDFFGVNL